MKQIMRFARPFATPLALCAYSATVVAAFIVAAVPPLRQVAAEVPLMGWLVVLGGAVAAGTAAVRWAEKEPEKKYVVEE